MGLVNVAATADCWCGNAIAIVTRYLLSACSRHKIVLTRVAAMAYWAWGQCLGRAPVTTTAILVLVEDYQELRVVSAGTRLLRPWQFMLEDFESVS